MLWFCASLSGDETAQNIVHARLDPRTVIRLPVAVDRLTTVYFPGRISGLESAFVTPDGEPPARFQCAFLPGQRYFSVRAVQTNASANINVVWNGGVFVFELNPSTNPIYALVLSAPVRSEGSRTESTPAVGLTGPSNAPSAFRSLPLSTNRSATRSWPLVNDGPLLGAPLPGIVPVPEQPSRIIRGTQPVPPLPITNSQVSVVATNKARPRTADKREKKERWWSRLRIPYLIEITINPPNSDRRP